MILLHEALHEDFLLLFNSILFFNEHQLTSYLSEASPFSLQQDFILTALPKALLCDFSHFLHMERQPKHTTGKTGHTSS